MTSALSLYMDVYTRYGLPIITSWNKISQGIFNHYHGKMVNSLSTVIIPDIDDKTQVDYSQRLAELTQKLADMDNTIVQLKQESATYNDTINKQNLDLQLDDQKIQSMQNTMNEKDAQIATLQSDAASNSTRISTLLAALSDATARADSNAADLQVAIKQNADLSAKNDAMMKDLTDTKAQLDVSLAANDTAATKAKQEAFAQAFDMCVKLAAKGQVDNALAAATVIRSVFIEETK